MNDVQHYHAPQTLSEAAAILAQGDATILAGGTDLMVQSQVGRVQIKSTLLNVRRIEELRGIREEGGWLRVGALTTISELMAHPLIARHAAILVQTGDVFASPQIRNAGTLGGNICNASPAGDTLPPLLVLRAEVELVAQNGAGLTTRRLPVAEFFAGPGRTHRQANELLAAIWIPKTPDGFVAHFEKFGTRPALDISTVSIALGGVWRDGALYDVRVAFGAVAPIPFWAAATISALEGQVLHDDTIAAAAAAAKAEINPIDDVRATAWYRKELIANLMQKVLRHVAHT